MTKKRALVLLLEDDDQRAAAIKACVPPDIHCVWAKSAGAARCERALDGKKE